VTVAVSEEHCDRDRHSAHHVGGVALEAAVLTASAVAVQMVTRHEQVAQILSSAHVRTEDLNA
jgi:hypothetical protein